MTASGSTARPSAWTAVRPCADLRLGPPGYALQLPALVAQGIEHRPPEPGAQVRILPRALSRASGCHTHGVASRRFESCRGHFLASHLFGRQVVVGPVAF